VLDRELRLASCAVDVPEQLRIVSVYAAHGCAGEHWHDEFKLAFFDA
jgi:hypothetical protein